MRVGAGRTCMLKYRSRKRLVKQRCMPVALMDSRLDSPWNDSCTIDTMAAGGVAGAVGLHGPRAERVPQRASPHCQTLAKPSEPGSDNESHHP